MSGEKIIRALDAIPDEQLQSAMNVYERRKKLKYIWLRVVLVLIVLAVLVFLLVSGSIGKTEPQADQQSACVPVAAQTTHYARP